MNIFVIITLLLPMQICTPPPHAGDIRVMIQFDGRKGRHPRKATKGSLHVCIQQARQLNLLHGEATFVQWLVCHTKFLIVCVCVCVCLLCPILARKLCIIGTTVAAKQCLSDSAYKINGYSLEHHV